MAIKQKDKRNLRSFFYAIPWARVPSACQLEACYRSGVKNIYSTVLMKESDPVRILEEIIGPDLYLLITPNLALCDQMLTIIIEMRERAEKLSYRRFISLFPSNLDDEKAFFTKCKVSTYQLRKFVTKFTKSVIPLSLFGEENFPQLVDFIVKYLSEEHRSLKIPSLKVRKVKFLRHFCDIKKRGVSVSLMQNRLLSKIVVFCTKLVSVELARYVRNVSKGNQSHVYYPKVGYYFWMERNRRKFHIDYRVQRIAEEEQRVGQRPLYESRNLTFLPTGSSLRPIIVDKDSNFAYMMELKRINKVLDFAMRRTGCKHRTITSEVRKLKTFLNKRKEKELYYAKVDVAKSFANVKRDRLRIVLEDMFTKCRYISIANCYATSIGAKRKTLFMVGGRCPNEAEALLRKSLKKAKLTTCSDITSKSYTGNDFVNSIMKLLNYKYVYKDKHFVMLEGIPQGFALSTRLQDIYLTSYITSQWSAPSSSNSCVIRFADDIIICSEKKDTVVNIVKSLNTPCSLYGIYSQQTKTETSFDMENVRRSGDIMSWCGRRIDTKNNSILRKALNVKQATRMVRVTGRRNWRLDRFNRNEMIIREYKLWKRFNPRNDSLYDTM